MQVARFWLSEIFAKSEQHPQARIIHVSLMTDSKDPLCLEPTKVHFFKISQNRQKTWATRILFSKENVSLAEKQIMICLDVKESLAAGDQVQLFHIPFPKQEKQIFIMASHQIVTDIIEFQPTWSNIRLLRLL